MKNLLIGVALLGLALGCKSTDEFSVTDPEGASVPSSECASACATECSEAEKAECAASKSECSAAEKAECSTKVCPVTGKPIEN